MYLFVPRGQFLKIGASRSPEMAISEFYLSLSVLYSIFKLVMNKKLYPHKVLLLTCVPLQFIHDFEYFQFQIS